VNDATTLSTLIQVSKRYGARRRELCCPECGGRVTLREERLHCVQMYMSNFPSQCGWSGERLVELAVES